MPAQPKAVLLDMDGTLFDSEAIYKILWQGAAEKFGLNLTDEYYRRFIGARYDQCVDYVAELGGPGFDIDSYMKSMEKDELKLKSTPIPLKPGAMKLLDWLQNNNISTGLVTSSSRQRVTQCFAHYNGYDRFQVIITGDDVHNPKPNPEPYLLACEQMGIQPEEAIAVEDSNTGALSAIQAKCQTVMIPDVLPAEDTILQKIHFIMETMEQLPEWLEKQFIQARN